MISLVSGFSSVKWGQQPLLRWVVVRSKGEHALKEHSTVPGKLPSNTNLLTTSILSLFPDPISSKWQCI